MCLPSPIKSPIQNLMLFSIEEYHRFWIGPSYSQPPAGVGMTAIHGQLQYMAKPWERSACFIFVLASHALAVPSMQSPIQNLLFFSIEEYHRFWIGC